MKDQLQLARDAGYSDDEIADHLGQKYGFDTAGAREAGYDTPQILTTITNKPVYSMSGLEKLTAGWGGGSRNFGRLIEKTSPLGYAHKAITGNDFIAPNDAEDEKALRATTEGAIGFSGGEAAPLAAIPFGGFAKTVGGLTSKAFPRLGTSIGKSWLADATLAGGAQGVVEGASESLDKDPANFSADVGRKAAAGGLFGLGGGIAMRTGQKLISPFANHLTPPVKKIAEESENLGYRLTAAQLSDNPFLRRTEAQSVGSPIFGSILKKRELGNEVVSNRRALSTIGNTTDDYATRDVLAKAEERIVKNLNVLDKPVKLDSAYITALQAAQKDQLLLMKTLKDPEVDKVYAEAVGIPSKYPGKVSVTSEAYLRNRKELTRKADQFVDSNPALAAAYRNVRNALDDAAGRSVSPEKQATWQEARKQYAHLQTIKRGVDPATGNIDKRIHAAIKSERPGDYYFGRNDNPLLGVANYENTFKKPSFDSAAINSSGGGMGIMNSIVRPGTQALALGLPHYTANGVQSMEKVYPWLKSDVGRAIEMVLAQRGINKSEEDKSKPIFDWRQHVPFYTP